MVNGPSFSGCSKVTRELSKWGIRQAFKVSTVPAPMQVTWSQTGNMATDSHTSCSFLQSYDHHLWFSLLISPSKVNREASKLLPPLLLFFVPKEPDCGAWDYGDLMLHSAHQAASTSGHTCTTATTYRPAGLLANYPGLVTFRRLLHCLCLLGASRKTWTDSCLMSWNPHLLMVTKSARIAVAKCVVLLDTLHLHCLAMDILVPITFNWGVTYMYL